MKNLDRKLVIGVATGALFDQKLEDNIFKQEGELAYARYQQLNRKKIQKPGIAFPFIKRLLYLNKLLPDQKPVEVMLITHNTPFTVIRTFNSIEHYGLDIVRGSFYPGVDLYDYLPVFNVSLFLSANESDVRQAVKLGHPAGLVVGQNIHNAEMDDELRIAFDFDGILVDDRSEQIFKQYGLDAFQKNEREMSG